jgi:hypothetical protein
VLNLNLKKMKKILETLTTIFNFVCPKSRWGNLVYGILGLAVANYDNIEGFVKAVLALFKAQ